MYIYENRWGAYIKGEDKFFPDYDKAKEYCKENNINPEEITEDISFRIVTEYNHSYFIGRVTEWEEEHCVDYDTESRITYNECDALNEVGEDYTTVYLLVNGEEYAEIEQYSNGSYNI